jgi:hypothetical protein
MNAKGSLQVHWDTRFGWMGDSDVTKQIIFIVTEYRAGMPRLQNTATDGNTRKLGEVTVYVIISVIK